MKFVPPMVVRAMRRSHIAASVGIWQSDACRVQCTCSVSRHAVFLQRFSSSSTVAHARSVDLLLRFSMPITVCHPEDYVQHVYFEVECGGCTNLLHVGRGAGGLKSFAVQVLAIVRDAARFLHTRAGQSP